MHRRLTIALIVTFVSLSIGLLSAQARSLEFVVQLAGTAVGELRNIDTDGDGSPDQEANCFDVALIEPNSGLQVGEASDCLSNVEVLNADDPDCDPDDSLVGCAVRLVDTTIFRFTDGTIVAQGAVSIPVVLDDDSRAAGVTHITGSFPTGDNILYGTERFKGVKGNVRLSGAVDMSNTVANNEITFDCLFILRANR